MALQTLTSTLPCLTELMDAFFGDLFLNVGRVSLLTFPLRSGMVRPFLFDTISGSGRAY